MACPFTSLPQDIVLLVLVHLNVPEPLFVPGYGAKATGGYDLSGQQFDMRCRLYGTRSPEQDEAAEALMSWSSTCRFFRNLLGPMCFRSVVLRAKPVSLVSIQALQKGTWWPYVEELIFAGAYTLPDMDPDEPETKDQEEESNDQDEESDNQKEESNVDDDGESDGNDGEDEEETEGAEKEEEEEESNDDEDENNDQKEESSDVASEDAASQQSDDGTTEDERINSRYLETVDFEVLEKVLSKLPPNLSSLTLDFPTEWVEEMDDDYLAFFVHETARQLSERENRDMWRKLLKVVLQSVSSVENIDRLAVRSNEAKQKGHQAFIFDLALHNVPPLAVSVYPGSLALPCAALHRENFSRKPSAKVESFDEPQMTDAQSRFAQLLSFCTSFTFAGAHWDNGAGWSMATNLNVGPFCGALPTYMFNHLSSSCRKFEIHADESWMLGIRDIMTTDEKKPALPLSNAALEGDRPGLSPEALSNVREVIMRNCFIGWEMLEFFEERRESIDSIVLEDCFSSYYRSRIESDDAMDQSWSTFLEGLARLPRLNKVEVSYTGNHTDKKRAWSVFRRKDDNGKVIFSGRRSILDSETVEISLDELVSEENAWNDKKQKFGYGTYDSKYGDCLEYESETDEAYERGEDWRSWASLCESINEQAKGNM